MTPTNNNINSNNQLLTCPECNSHNIFEHYGENLCRRCAYSWEDRSSNSSEMMEEKEEEK